MNHFKQHLTHLLTAGLVLAGVSQATPQPVQKTEAMPIYVHFMPWFESKDFSGYWGAHWTMGTRYPDTQDETGHRQIATHYYPLTGPYASADPDIIEYQLLLMKLSGIDGVMIDWPGTTDLYDYPRNKSNAEALIGQLGRFGLKYAMVYEDHNINIAFEKGVVTDRMAQARQDVQDLVQNHFSSSNYIQMEGHPFLTVFGPQTFENPEEWKTLFADLPEQPCLLAIWREGSQVASACKGEFSWVLQNEQSHLDLLSAFYRSPALGRVKVGSAYPGFHDFYKEGGWGAGYFNIPVGLDTFKTTLDLALQSDLKAVQLVTWNDYGEGTMIEPTEQFGFDFLTYLQQKLGVKNLNKADLELVLELYKQRKQHAGNTEEQGRLDQVSDLLAELKVSEARALLIR
ncbi:glycoside hydrolase family 71/99-like protein [Deinococcus roseus]|uniref:Uncharacterized protein n=1 Tax=Deinococcus roseus TaxID=392414 RepID=A0ABQ2DDK5_9DEIO|nr:glycoside hydrolase family 71/99-like protein [Deinococcus roseus]GGJ54468.1 hypothetical protein GCM10008938_45720 [Deinococcus roseus]